MSSTNSHDLAAIYAERWQQPQPPDLLEFLAHHPDASPQEVAAVVLSDQYQRWSNGETRKVEEYIRLIPNVANDHSLQFDLIEEEIGYLEARGQLPTQAALRERFRHLSADQLDRLVNDLNLHGSEDHIGVELRDAPPPCPQTIGRYQVESRLGTGAFGDVYLATDPELGRQVAIKLPKSRRVSHRTQIESFKREAQILAKLDHPGIVPVYDFGVSKDQCFVVSKYIEGSTLRQAMPKSFTIAESVNTIATIARALYHAHQLGLVHRDIKPANILIDADGLPHVTDFGLALRDEDFGVGTTFVGTPAYMSPEQARGEGHRVDARSDIYSLGVILYELLAKRRPYRSSGTSSLIEQIQTGDLRPPRQFESSIPRALDRICMKALARRASDRYSTAIDLAEDLEACAAEWSSVSTQTTRSDSRPAPTSVGHEDSDGQATGGSQSSTSAFSGIVPKGLRCFDQNDADFYLELVPGPRDRHGTPDCLRFWKNQIESQDSECFSVGLLYGPSGCGKSSLIQAGLLPLLDERIATVYVEATAKGTSQRLLNALRRKRTALPETVELKEAIVKLRQSAAITGQKTLIIIDQFEQWLHAWNNDSQSTLVSALRQCNGEGVQTLLLVRDDFWMAATRFMRELELPLIEHQNSAAVDLFDRRHASKVLQAYGVAFGTLPDCVGDRSDDQRQFVEQAIDGLAVDGKIVSVRLALFAEMVKSEPWTTETLQKLGGSRGIGLAYLETAFGSGATPQRKLHANGAKRVLESLLPEAGANIKGNMQSVDHLARITAGEARDTEELLRILDGELRLITPTEPDRSGELVDAAPANHAGYYQLTHDYLVPSIREWLDRSLQGSRKGRAQLRLRDLSATWRTRPESRLLPSFLEYVQIRLLTTKDHWNTTQREFMNAAWSRHAKRGLWMSMAIAICGFLGYEALGRANARQQLERMLVAKTSELAEVVDLDTRPNRWLKRELESVANDKQRSNKQRKHAALALVLDGPDRVAFLAEQVPTADSDDIQVIVNALIPHRDDATEQLWPLIQADERTGRLNVAAALAQLASTDDRRWKDAANQLAEDATVQPDESRLHIERLRPIAKQLVGPLLRLAQNSDAAVRRSATSGVVQYATVVSNQRLADLVEHSDPTQFNQLVPLLASRGSECEAELRQRFRQPRHKPWPSLPTSTGLNEASRQRIQSAKGFVADDCALWFKMSMEHLAEITESLRSAGYRPINIRPYSSSDGLMFASCWVRDDSTWEFAFDLNAEEIETVDKKHRDAGLLPDDVSCYFRGEDANEPLAAIVWREFNASNVRREFYAANDTPSHEEQQTRWTHNRLYGRSRHLTSTPNGKRLRHSMIWALDPDNREDGFFYLCGESAFRILQTTQRYPTDVSVTRLVGETGPFPYYSSIWVNRSTEFEAATCDSKEFGEHLDRSTKLLEQGYRPVAVSACEMHQDDWRLHSVWHRPQQSNGERNELARRQANCAVGTAHLGDHSLLLDALFNGSPTLKAESFARISEYECPVNGLIESLSLTNSADETRAAILALGQVKWDQVPESAQAKVKRFLQHQAAQQQNASLHAAAAWTLKQWKQGFQAPATQSAPSKDDQWYRDKNKHELIIFNRTQEDMSFLMGCPLDESGAQWEDRRFPKKLGRRFAMASTEVTRGQFANFLVANPQLDYVGQRTGNPDLPAAKASWFLVAQYCNWLSKRNDIPESEWCFEISQSVEEGVVIMLAENYLSRKGYRLPSEAEWEFCSRGGLLSAYPSGDTSHRLNLFEWFASNSENRPHPVGERMPNAFGMFDMLGNVREWCMERYESEFPRPRAEINPDIEDQRIVDRSDYRLVRGGDFESNAIELRYTHRQPLNGYKRRGTIGFRVVRTLD